ncbi:MAG: hypothetical protein QM537_01245 [Candidatus Symbiobacter sp.]|nr:hypothetical protein [Candidatus Symbiobacter sp.]
MTNDELNLDLGRTLIEMADSMERHGLMDAASRDEIVQESQNIMQRYQAKDKDSLANLAPLAASESRFAAPLA